jgi:hypothetical protein
MKNKRWILPLVLLLIVIFFAVWMCYAKRTSRNHIDSSSSVLPPVYLVQMESCRAFGGQVEEKEKNMGSWTALDKWRCVCQSGQETFGDNLNCNEWLNPDIGY